MQLQNNTIVITGGSSGLGLEMAKRLSGKNKVIICGRSTDKLQRAKELLPAIDAISCDISRPADCEQLAAYLRQNHPRCNVLINNAAIVHRTNFYRDNHMIEKAEKEIQTNLLGPVRLTKLLLPVIEKNPEPKVINITTGLVYAPRTIYPIYSATKAALHSFTQVLRVQLAETPVRVIEILFPVVDTPWHDGNVPGIAISPEKAVTEMLVKLKKGQTEIRIGKVGLLYGLSRIAPSFAFKKINSL